MTSGEVVPIPGNVLPICATAGPQPNTSVKAINAGRILSCLVGRKRSARARGRSARATHPVRCSEGQADAMIIEFGLSAIGDAAQVVFRTWSLLTDAACSSGKPDLEYKVGSGSEPLAAPEFS
jgi:hypothetical protein